jgi:hypothetical protein
LSCVSTWMGDRLGIRNVLDNFYLSYSNQRKVCLRGYDKRQSLVEQVLGRVTH